MADTKDDIKDDRDMFIRKVAAIKLELDNHAAVPPAVAVPITKEVLEFDLEELKRINLQLDKLQARTLRVFRGKSAAEINTEVALNDDLHKQLKLSTLQAHKILNELQTQVSSRVKILKAEPPSFDGKSTSWTSFLDQFDTMVVNNAQFSATEKLAYLKKSLEKGPAHHIVQNFSLTDLDWVNAWAAVKARYNHEREIAYAHINKLFDLTPITYQSQNGIRHIIDTVHEVIRALNNLHIDTDEWGLIFIYIIRKNLDNRTKTDFEKSLPNDKLHTLQVLLDFLNNLATALGIAGIVDKNPIHKEDKDSKSSKSETVTSAQGKTSSEPQKKLNFRCVFCQKDHRNATCPTLIPLTIHQRNKLVGEKSICKNCLRPNHTTETCRAPACGTNGCKFRHHPLLHYPKRAETNSTTVDESKVDTKTVQTNTICTSLSTSKTSSTEVSGFNVLLSTAVINIIVKTKIHTVRALIDQGSQVNLMTEKLANMLCLIRKPSTISISGIGNSKPNFAKGCSSLEIQSRIDSDWTTHIDCYILSELTSNKPSQKIDCKTLNRFKNLKLADDTFNVPGPIDIILGAQVFLDILGNEHFRGFPTALDTKLGYVITGSFESQETETVSTLTCDVNFDLTRFWQQEELPSDMKFSPEEQAAEDSFTQTHVQNIDGAFTVALPFIQHKNPLGESRGQAEKRLFQIERKLNKYPDKRVMYHTAMNEYINEGYVKEITSYNAHKAESFYLPHHYVEKESTTTKFRVVFDGSAKTTSGFSLNDNLLVGPCIQNDLLKILLRFREHAFVFSADIKKMYLQIGICEKDQNYLKFLWRDNPLKPIREFKYKVIPFGLSSSPFLAIRTLHQLARNNINKYPVGSETLIYDFYVDDCLSGSDTIQSALEKQAQLRAVLESGQFLLRKWSSNCPELLESIPMELRETQLPLEIESTDQIKTLGILWSPASDNFTFRVILPIESKFTKRLVASYAAKTYDPTGLVQPVIIIAKIILQELWESKTGWDEVIPDQINQKWKTYLSNLPELESLQIPRHVMPTNPQKLILHGFCDASKRAYGAVIYVAGVSSDNVVSSHLFTSKSKVAPLRVMTIPRLELQGAVMVTKLVKNVLSTCRSIFHEIHYWSDSSIVLSQLNKPSRSFKTFVGNRVSYIQGNSDQNSWHYVNTKDNPADLVSRGVSPAELIASKLWWHGPDWIQSVDVPIKPIPKCSPGTDLEQIQELASLSCSIKHCWIDSVVKQFNQLWKLKRVIARILRLAWQKDISKPTAWIRAFELSKSLTICIKLIQAQHFQKEIKWLHNNVEFPKGNKLKSLSPFIDLNGMLRVGGRLQEAEHLSEDMKHPLILPKNHHIVKLILHDIHERYKHAAPQLMVSIVRSEYWVLGLKTSANRCIKSCIKCQKVSAETGVQMMGNLPRSRISKTRAFLHVGVDYAGPILVLPKSGRGQKSVKAWIAVFVCFTTKAVHLELVSELSTNAYIAALKRFASRRGKPDVIYSDVGTNFTGARNEMQAFQNEMEKIASHNEVAQSLANDGIEWKLNPPGAPHMGSLWEAAVKSMKHHLKRVSSAQNFTFEEMYTLLCEIEACLNSRPLTPISNDPNDFLVLTPGHFLIGEPLVAVPSSDLTQVKMNRLNRWEIIQQQNRHFWIRWSLEYLNTLQFRPKWLGPKRNFMIGDMVLIKDESMAPLKWKIGRVLEIHPGKDGKVRVVTVKAVTVQIDPQNKSKEYLDKFKVNVSILKRPIHKLVHLAYDNDNDSHVDLDDTVIDNEVVVDDGGQSDQTEER